MALLKIAELTLSYHEESKELGKADILCFSCSEAKGLYITKLKEPTTVMADDRKR